MPHRPRPPVVTDRLESRTLLATVAVVGTLGPDLITLAIAGDELTVTLNGVPSVHPAAEISGVNIDARDGEDRVVIHDAGDMLVGFTAGAGDDVLELASLAGGIASFFPNGEVPGYGAALVGRGSGAVIFAGLERAEASGYARLEYVTPREDDRLALAPAGSGRNQITGTSSAFNLTPFTFADIGVLRLDLARQEADGNTDRLSVTGELAGADLLELDAGLGNNVASFDGAGEVALDTNFGPSGGSNLTVEADAAALTFTGPQQLRALYLEDGAAARFTGGTGAGGHRLETLWVRGGVNVIDVDDGQRLVVGSHDNFYDSAAIGANAALIKRGGGELFLDGVDHVHESGARLQADAGALRLSSDAGQFGANLHVLSSARTTFESPQHLASLQVVGGTTTLSAAGDRILRARTFSMTGSEARLDLTDNAMVVEHVVADSSQRGLAEDVVRALLRVGYNGGAWDGAGGITSSAAAAGGNTALGYATGADLFATFPATFLGEPVEATDVLVRHTFYGDTDLDGAVNLNDFNRLAAHFGAAERNWAHGDADFDRAINLSDFNRLAANFGATPGAARFGANEPDRHDEPHELMALAE